MPNENYAYVLYVDHQDHPAPLSCCFHATASRRLSSTIDRQHRPSTVTQVDSAFCPQCLSFHDASSASQLGYCPKPTCLQCPLCTSVVSVQKFSAEGDNCFLFKCGRCVWNSKQCGLTVPCPSADEPSKEEMAAAMEQLAEALQARRTAMDPDKLAEKRYRSMVNAWEGLVKPNHPSSAARKILPSAKQRKEDDDGTWSVEALEASMQQKQQSWKQQSIDSVLGGGHEVQRITLDEPREAQGHVLDSSRHDLPALSMFMQQSVASSPATAISDLLPLPMPLRARKSRRCRAELAEGRPGIVLKPKLNPLEGDSSLRSGRGQWWKKDSSAVHVVPKVRVVRHGSSVLQTDPNRRQHAFLLRVSNPTLGPVRLRLGASKYSGEPFWEDDSESEQTKRNPFMKDLLVDSLTDKHVDVSLFVSVGGDDVKSDMVELESSEDAFVDMGALHEVPDEVMNWAANSAADGAARECDLDGTYVLLKSVKLIKKSTGGIAWFELVCEMSSTTAVKDGPMNKPAVDFNAVPVSLEIEVGQGSWESSLVKAKDTVEGQEPDTVAFDLLLTWPRSDS